MYNGSFGVGGAEEVELENDEEDEAEEEVAVLAAPSVAIPPGGGVRARTFQTMHS